MRTGFHAMRRRHPFLLALLVFVAGCRGNPPAPGRYAPGDAGHNLDHGVLDAALSDLLESPDFLRPGLSRPRIVLGDATLPSGAGASTCSGNDADKGVPEDALQDLRSRNPKGTSYSLAAYRPTDPRVVVADLGPVFRRDPEGDAVYASYPDARGYVQPLLPGYSRDGRTAVFRFSFGPTGHWGFGSYRLDREGGRWAVTSRFLFYGN